MAARVDGAESDVRPIARTNATSRMHANLQRIATMKGDGPVAEWIGHAIAPNASPQSSDKIHRGVSFLVRLDHQLDAVRGELTLNPVIDEDIWIPEIDRTRAVLRSFSSGNLTSYWSSVRGNLPPELVQHYMYWGRMLPQTEIYISDSDVSAIHAALDSLKAAAVDSSVPASLRALIVDIILQLEEALSAFAARGGRALSDVLLTFADALWRNESEIVRNSGGPGVSSLAAAWSAVLRITKPYREANGVAGLFERAHSGASAVPDFLSNAVALLGGPGS